LFCFFGSPLTTKSMGICPSTDGQSECGLACGRQEQNCRNARH